MGGVTIVCDNDEKFVGIIGTTDWKWAINYGNIETTKIKDIVNRECISISDCDPYVQARNIYAEKNIEYLPVINEKRDVIDLFTRKRAFYKYFFDNNKLDKMNYAKMVYASAIQAKRLGYRAISVIEFGVAMGNGLLALQFHAREISRLLGIEIQVYGFDTGKGLPSYDVSHLDMPFQWQQGLFEMDFSGLNQKLESAKLIIGDISHTISAFFHSYQPAPIGMISVDVDLYTSTLPILKMLENNGMEYFVPRIYMYFDDILGGYECLGQNMAIKSFNKRNEGVACISPEGTECGIAWLHGVNRPRYYDDNIKICHLFNHPDYDKFIRNNTNNIPIRNYNRTV